MSHCDQFRIRTHAFLCVCVCACMDSLHYITIMRHTVSSRTMMTLLLLLATVCHRLLLAAHIRELYCADKSKWCNGSSALKVVVDP